MDAAASRIESTRISRGLSKCFAFLIAMLCIVVALVVASPAFAEEGDGSNVLDSGTCGGNLTWVLTDDYVLTISGYGKMDSYDAVSKFAPWDAYKRKIVSLKIGDDCASIGSYAFAGCSSLEEVVVPSSVRDMGSGVFADCTSLKAAEIRAYCYKLPSYTFARCASLESVELPEICWVIGDHAFNFAGSGSFAIPETVTVIEGYAFAGCRFTELTIPGSVTSIFPNVIVSSNTLETVILGEGVEILGDENLSRCPNLRRLDLPSTITTLGYHVLYDSVPNKLDMLVIPESLVSFADFESINGMQFTCVRQVDTVDKWSHTLEEINPDIAWIQTADGGLVRLSELYEYGGNKGRERLSGLTGVVPNAIVDYGTCGDGLTFQLTSDGVLHIYGDGAMDDARERSIPDAYYDAKEDSVPWAWYAHEVRKVVFEGGCTRVGAGVFADCKNLSQAILPASVESIGKDAFSNTPNLRIGVKSEEQIDLVTASGFTDTSRISVLDGDESEELDLYGEWGFYHADVALSATRLTYSGKVRHPSVTMTYRGETLREGVDYALEFSEGSKAVGKYQVMITSRGKFGRVGIRGYTYYIVPKKVTSRSLYKSGKYLVAKWYKPSTSFTKYKVQVSTSSSFASGKTITKYVSKSKKKLTMSGIKKGKTYYFRIMAVKSTANDGLVEGSWSKVKKYRVR